MTGIDWNYEAASHETHKIGRGLPKLGREREGFPHRCQRKQGPTDSWIIDILPPELIDFLSPLVYGCCSSCKETNTL